jgi:arylformamidase
VATAAVNYALRPEVTIDEIVRRVRAAIVGTYGNTKGFGDDSEHIHVAGDSASIRRLLRGLE